MMRPDHERQLHDLDRSASARRMTALASLGGLSLLLLAGLALQVFVRPLRRLLLPVPVIGGFVGIAVGPDALDIVPREMVALWAGLPGVLINIIFGALFLGVRVPALATLVRLGGPLLRFSAVTALGQYVVALLVTWLVLVPLFETPPLFACILEVGFAGGHGTAGAMASVFADLGFPAGAALGQMSATVGLVAGVVTGVALIQYGVRRGYTTQLRPHGHDAGAIYVHDDTGLIAPPQRRSIATGTITASILEPLTLHLAIAGLAVGIGWVLLGAVRALHPALQGFPLFPLAMVGGMAIQVGADRSGASTYVDRETFQRITGLSLDLLVVAAVASLQLDLFLEHLVPFVLVMVAGIVWMLGTFLLLAPRMLPTDWFEQAIVVYGTQTGVTAIGLMLLRIVDPQNRTTAAQAFAARSMVSSPLVGGGLITATMPLVIQSFGMVAPLVGLTLVILALSLVPTRRTATTT